MQEPLLIVYLLLFFPVITCWFVYMILWTTGALTWFKHTQKIQPLFFSQHSFLFISFILRDSTPDIRVSLGSELPLTSKSPGWSDQVWSTWREKGKKKKKFCYLVNAALCSTQGTEHSASKCGIQPLFTAKGKEHPSQIEYPEYICPSRIPGSLSCEIAVPQDVVSSRN